MKIDAIGVVSTNLKKTAAFYEMLGFEFPEFRDDEQHVEAITKEGGIRLMIDSFELIKQIIGIDPQPSNHSSFAILCERPETVNNTVEKVRAAGGTIVKEPWDAFWGQRYAVVADPDGYMIDLFAAI